MGLVRALSCIQLAPLLGPWLPLLRAGLLKGLFIPVWTTPLAASKTVYGKSYFSPNQKSSGLEHKHSAHYLEITSPLLLVSDQSSEIKFPRRGGGLGSADLCLPTFFIQQLKKGTQNLPSGLGVWPAFASREKTALLGVEAESIWLT